MTIRVLLVDDQRVFREALQSFLGKPENNIEVAGEAIDGRDALKQVRALKPDVVVLDVAMPGMNGFTAAAKIRARYPGTKVLALSAHADKRYVMGMLNAGVAGYVSKAAAGQELVQAIQAVAAGHSYLGPDLTDAVTGALRETHGGPGQMEILSRREREVLQLLAEGRRSAAIATQLSIALGTVEAHRRNIMRKLRLHSSAELTKYAIREGLTSL